MSKFGEAEPRSQMFLEASIKAPFGARRRHASAEVLESGVWRPGGSGWNGGGRVDVGDRED